MINWQHFELNTHVVDPKKILFAEQLIQKYISKKKN